VYILLLAIIISVELLSNLGVGYVMKRSALAFPFVLAALPIIFTAPGPTLATFSLGPWTLAISIPGIERFASITIKSWISVQAAIVLAASTSFPDLLVAMRAIKIPRLLVAIFSLMWRYLFVLADETIRLMRARSARSGDAGQPGLKKGGSVFWRARVTGGMAGNLFLRALERSDRIYMAMLSRGYDGEIRSLPLPKLQNNQLALLGASLTLLFALLMLSFVL
jgi:cobalt/nickel transport system permease protein